MESELLFPVLYILFGQYASYFTVIKKTNLALAYYTKGYPFASEARFWKCDLFLNSKSNQSLIFIHSWRDTSQALIFLFVLSTSRRQMIAYIACCWRTIEARWRNTIIMLFRNLRWMPPGIQIFASVVACHRIFLHSSIFSSIFLLFYIYNRRWHEPLKWRNWWYRLWSWNFFFAWNAHYFNNLASRLTAYSLWYSVCVITMSRMLAEVMGSVVRAWNWTRRAHFLKLASTFQPSERTIVHNATDVFRVVFFPFMRGCCRHGDSILQTIYTIAIFQICWFYFFYSIFDLK